MTTPDAPRPHEGPPRALAEWLRLPELPLPAVASPNQKGDVHLVLAVGCLPPEDSGLLPPVPMPWVTVAGANTGVGERTYRLPPPLAPWALDVLGQGPVAASAGRRVTIPCRVEFGDLEDRPYAEFVPE